MKKITLLASLICAALFLTTSCEDMLTPEFDRYAEEDQFGKDSIYSALGIVRSIQNVAERTVILGDARGDLFTTGTYTTDSIASIVDFGDTKDESSTLLNVADFYHVVNSCNFYLANVDTTVTKNNIKIMQREWAQVQAMRAWAYIQLVRFYGEVPFVTLPVRSTSEADAMKAKAPKVNAANLASMLNESGLSRALEIQNALGMPSYGELSYYVNGKINTAYLFFPVQLVMADAYLMGNNYEQSANMYYRYMMDVKRGKNLFRTNRNYKAGYSKGMRDGVDFIERQEGSLALAFGDGGLSNDELLTVCVGAGSSYYGTVLNNIQNIYGYKTTIKSGSTSVEGNEQYQQLLPSSQYVSLNSAQRYNLFEQSGEVAVISDISGGDGRILAYAPRVKFMNGDINYSAAKFVRPSFFSYGLENYTPYSAFSKNYFIPLYRTPIMLLRYAEAVNRLGFPELAFGMIKDGIMQENLPSIKTMATIARTGVVTIQEKNDEGVMVTVKTMNWTMVGKLVNDGVTANVDYKSDSSIVVYGDKYVGDTIWNTAADAPEGYTGTILANIPQSVQDSWNNIEYVLEPAAVSGGMYYLSDEELKGMTKYPFLDFSASQWSESQLLQDAQSHYGIHSRGCFAVGGRCDTVFTYARQVAEHIAQDYARKNGLSYAEQMAYAKTLYKVDTLYVTDKELIQNAVENIIVDELALEGAFEGHRFTDLIRIAEHKNKAGFDGTEWLAWKIARRNKNFMDNASEVDGALKAKLLDANNWYFKLP